MEHDEVNWTGLRVLVVDDEPGILELFRDELESSGATVTIASSGDEASALLKKEEYDIVFLDLVMPGGDGFSVINNSDIKLPATLIITGYPLDQNPPSIGKIPILRKPFSWEDLNERSKSLLAQQA